MRLWKDSVMHKGLGTESLTVLQWVYETHKLVLIYYFEFFLSEIQGGVSEE